MFYEIQHATEKHSVVVAAKASCTVFNLWVRREKGVGLGSDSLSGGNVSGCHHATGTDTQPHKAALCSS